MRRPSIGAIVAAVLFALWSLDSWVQVALWLAHRSDDPSALALFHVGIGAAGAWAAASAWRRGRAVWIAGILTGAITCAMLVALPKMLALPPEATRGLVTGGVATILIALVLAWLARPRRAVAVAEVADGSR